MKFGHSLVDYFLSYSRKDGELANQLVDGVSEVGFATFMDTRNITPGDRWDHTVQQALRQCKCFIVLLSPDSVESDQVLDKVSYALDHHKKLVPFLVRECDVPLRVQRFERVDFHGDFDVLTHPLHTLLDRKAIDNERLEPQSWERPSMVVLPFANLSWEADSDMLCYGLLHEIVESLSLNKEFFVVASGTSLSYRDTRQSIRRISEDLGVRYVVSGTLQRHADRLRVRAELSNGENERVLWTDHYDRETSDLLLLQEDIARTIAVQLQPRVTRAEIKRVALRARRNNSAPASCFSGLAVTPA